MVTIRRAKGEDAEKILECCRIVGGESDNLTFGAEGIVAMTVEKEAAYLDSIFESDRQLYLVAECDGDIVGTACLATFGKPRLAHRGEVSLSVKKAMWGRHIGSRFLEEIIRFARESAKVDTLSLEVRSDNARAIALYEKFGFKKVGAFDGFLRIDGEDISCDFMRLRL